MNEQITKDHPKSRVKKGSSPFGYLAILLIAFFLIAGSYFFTQKRASTSYTGQGDSSTSFEKQQQANQKNPRTSAADSREKDIPPGQIAVGPEIDRTSENPPDNARSMDSSNAPGQNNQIDANSLTTSDTSSSIRQRFSAGGDPQLLADKVNSFYAHLDQQPYMQNFGLKKPSKVYFSGLAQKLIDNPPVIFRETDNLFTLLQNTAHFFRILGKDNINILKEILDKEHDSFEPVLKAFYGLTYQPDYMKKEYGLSIPPAVRIDYAAFFLNTMGGRLYLFRRDPRLRMVISYYAIITIDRANAEGNGGHGIDLRPAIRSLIDEIENGGERLQLKDEYLDVLYDLQEKYN